MSQKSLGNGTHRSSLFFLSLLQHFEEATQNNYCYVALVMAIHSVICTYIFIQLYRCTPVTENYPWVDDLYIYRNIYI